MISGNKMELDYNTCSKHDFGINYETLQRSDTISINQPSRPFPKTVFHVNQG